MNTNGKSIIRLSIWALGALLIGVPGTAALAAEPTTAGEAEAAAQHSRDLAAQYRQLGGVGYKTGLVQRADADATRFSALAEQLRAPAIEGPRSAEAARYAQLAEQYRQLGGVGYKTGLVQWAEAQQRKAEPAPTTAPLARPVGELPTFSFCLTTKPAVRVLACSN
jgi:hypothetical protein